MKAARVQILSTVSPVAELQRVAVDEQQGDADQRHGVKPAGIRVQMGAEPVQNQKAMRPGSDGALLPTAGRGATSGCGSSGAATAR